MAQINLGKLALMIACCVVVAGCKGTNVCRDSSGTRSLFTIHESVRSMLCSVGDASEADSASLIDSSDRQDQTNSSDQTSTENTVNREGGDGEAAENLERFTGFVGQVNDQLQALDLTAGQRDIDRLLGNLARATELAEVINTQSSSALLEGAVNRGLAFVEQWEHSAVLTWDVPGVREDGADLNTEEVGGFIIRYGLEGAFDQELTVSSEVRQVVIENLQEGRYQFQLITFDRNHIESQPSVTVSKTISS